jgi:hypothetical protein
MLLIPFSLIPAVSFTNFEVFLFFFFLAWAGGQSSGITGTLRGVWPLRLVLKLTKYIKIAP